MKYHEKSNDELLKSLDEAIQHGGSAKDNLPKYLNARLQKEQNAIMVNLIENIGFTNKWIKNLKESLDTNTDKIIESNRKLAESQNKHSRRIFWVTFGLVIVGAGQLLLFFAVNWPDLKVLFK